jgi:hypothetical protein
MHLQSHNTYFWRHCIGLTELLVFNCMLCMRRLGIAAVKQTADHSKIPTLRAAPRGSGHQVVPPWPPRVRGCCAVCCWRTGFPESWIPPAHVVEMRTVGRLYCTQMDERRAWQQRIHAQLFQQGCPPIRALLSAAGRDARARAELSAAGRQYVDTALRRIDELSAEIEPLRAQLTGFARREGGW